METVVGVGLLGFVPDGGVEAGLFGMVAGVVFWSPLRGPDQAGWEDGGAGEECMDLVVGAAVGGDTALFACLESFGWPRLCGSGSVGQDEVAAWGDGLDVVGDGSVGVGFVGDEVQ